MRCGHPDCYCYKEFGQTVPKFEVHSDNRNWDPVDSCKWHMVILTDPVARNVGWKMRGRVDFDVDQHDNRLNYDLYGSVVFDEPFQEDLRTSFQ